MLFNVIASGSKGNATIVKSGKTVILIDFGIPLCRLEEGLEEIHLKTEDVSGAIFTHNHSDHIRSIKEFSPKKMYALKGTLPPLTNEIELYKTFQIGDIKIIPFKTSHDATNPCGYLLSDEQESLVYMTDTGCLLEEALPYIKNPTYLIIESNHDMKMLMQSARPMELKQRILSEHGHLCNEDSAFIATSIVGDNTKEIVLAHLSEECNTPELALKAYHQIFNYKNINLDKYLLRCANQHVSLLGGHE